MFLIAPEHTGGAASLRSDQQEIILSPPVHSEAALNDLRFKLSDLLILASFKGNVIRVVRVIKVELWIVQVGLAVWTAHLVAGELGEKQIIQLEERRGSL